MKKYVFLFLLLFLNVSIFSQNEKIILADTSIPLCYYMKIGHKLLSFDNGDFEIRNVSYNGECLKIDYSYGGGCGTSFLDIYVDEISDFKNETMIHLYPHFKDEDTCKALKYDSSTYNLDLLLKDRVKPLAVKVGDFDKIVTIKK